MKLQFDFLNNEYWWGGSVDDGFKMPISSSDSYKCDLASPSTSNQSSPIYLSDKGRYIISDKPFAIEFDSGRISVEGLGDIKLENGFGSLKDAYFDVSKKYMNFNGEIPDELFFVKPQYNTWIELNHNQTQAGVMEYSTRIIESGLPAGILMIDAMWSDYFGGYTFHSGRFPNAKEMIADLHDMGFKVMVWISPVITPDSVTFRELRNTNCLIKNKDGHFAVRSWWDGFSCVLDLTCPDAKAWLKNQLDFMMHEYGVDGFKIDAGDNYFYDESDLTYEKRIPNEHSRAVCEFALEYKFNEFRTGWNMGGFPLVMRLCDKRHTWDDYGLNMLVPNSILQGLLGYAYSCPDMIGGGEYMNFNSHKDNLDEELFIRYAQVSAFMPMMQFSALPSRVLSKTSFDIIKAAAELHISFGKYIINLAYNASKTGEPIVRHLEYQFPNSGYSNCCDQFMLGDMVMVAPALEKGIKNRRVMIPEGVWVSDTGEKLVGPCEVVTDTPIQRVPYYVREGFCND